MQFVAKFQHNTNPERASVSYENTQTHTHTPRKDKKIKQTK